jgi:hypothetical protein
VVVRLPSERRLDLGYVPPRPEVMSTGDPANEGLPCDCVVLANISVCAPVIKSVVVSNSEWRTDSYQ